MRFAVLGLAGVAALAVAACSEGHAEASGPSTSRSFQVGGFTKVGVAGPFDVKIATGQPVSVAAQGPQRLIDAMEVVVEDGTLKIRTKRQGMFGGFSWSGGNAVVTIRVPSLEGVAVAGSGDVDVDKVSGQRFEGSIAGSGDLRLAQLNVKELKVSIAGSGGGKLAGQAETAKYSIAGSGDLDASGVTARDAEASIAGSGSIRARATGTAKASIAGSGDIDISGGARCESSKRGSGDIRCS